jgi:hypothetical protein
LNEIAPPRQLNRWALFRSRNHFLMKKILLNPAEWGYEAEVDDEDFEFLSGFKWSVSKTKTTVYAKAQVECDGRWYNIPMHRMVIGDAFENWDIPYVEIALTNGKTVFVIPNRLRRHRKTTVDHIDGNGLNNCGLNLRHASCAEQVANRRFR